MSLGFFFCFVLFCFFLILLKVEEKCLGLEDTQIPEKPETEGKKLEEIVIFKADINNKTKKKPKKKGFWMAQ